MPDSLLVVGGGVIACEFVSIFAALGVQVCVVDSHAQLLDYLSEDVVGELADSFLEMGVIFHMQERVSEYVTRGVAHLHCWKAASKFEPMQSSMHRAGSRIAEACNYRVPSVVAKDGWNRDQSALSNQHAAHFCGR